MSLSKREGGTVWASREDFWVS